MDGRMDDVEGIYGTGFEWFREGLRTYEGPCGVWS